VSSQDELPTARRGANAQECTRGKTIHRNAKEERIHATTSSIIHLEPKIDETVHRIDAELITKLEDKIKVWAYLMTQYNLKPGLRKFGTRGVTAAWG
jgi:hypothetical protein